MRIVAPPGEPFGVYAPDRRVNLIVLLPPTLPSYSNPAERSRTPSTFAPTAHTNFPIDKGAQLIQTNPLPPPSLSLSVPLYFTVAAPLRWKVNIAAPITLLYFSKTSTQGTLSFSAHTRREEEHELFTKGA